LGLELSRNWWWKQLSGNELEFDGTDFLFKPPEKEEKHRSFGHSRNADHCVLQGVIHNVYSLGMATSTLTIRLPKEQREALRRSAKALKKTESEYIRDLLARDLDAAPIGKKIAHLAGVLDSREAVIPADKDFRHAIRGHNWRRP
jgi:hypothetical protein